jgi:hypothetical protein
VTEQEFFRMKTIHNASRLAISIPAIAVILTIAQPISAQAGHGGGGGFHGGGFGGFHGGGFHGGGFHGGGFHGGGFHGGWGRGFYGGGFYGGSLGFNPGYYGWSYPYAYSPYS